MENQPFGSNLANHTAANPTPQASSSKTFYFVLLTGIIILIGSAYYLYEPGGSEVKPVSVEDVKIADPGGMLVLTATLDGPPAVFTLDLDQEGEALFKKYPAYEITAFPEFTDKFDPKKVFFTALTPKSLEESDKTGLHSWTVGTDPVAYYKSTAGNIETDLNWSEEAKQLAFFRLKASADMSASAGQNLDDREIVIFDPTTDTITTTIDGAAYPRWSPTGESLLYLKRDGIYEFNLAAKAEEKIKGLDQAEGILTPAEMLDVSPDGSKLIITSQGPGLISMFDILSWNPLVLSINHTFEDKASHYSSPQFSPDGQMYALFTLEKFGKEYLNPRLEIRNTDSAEVLYTRIVEAFDMTQFYVSDWVAKSFIPEVSPAN